MLQMMYDKWWKYNRGGGMCDFADDKGRKDANALAIDNVGGVFVVLAAGLALTPFVAAFEFVWRARREAEIGIKVGFRYPRGSDRNGIPCLRVIHAFWCSLYLSIIVFKGPGSQPPPRKSFKRFAVFHHFFLNVVQVVSTKISLIFIFIY